MLSTIRLGGLLRNIIYVYLKYTSLKAIDQSLSLHFPNRPKHLLIYTLVHHSPTTYIMSINYFIGTRIASSSSYNLRIEDSLTTVVSLEGNVQLAVVHKMSHGRLGVRWGVIIQIVIRGRCRAHEGHRPIVVNEICGNSARDCSGSCCCS